MHFAGGNCYSFKFLIPLLPSFEVYSLELPGRGRRIKETLLRDFDHAATDIYSQIFFRLNGADFFLYGHSMGAYLCLKVCSMLESAGKFPACLFVSGNAGPGVSENKRRYLLGTKDFIRELVSLGGFPREVIDNEELFGFFEPILRADFEIAEKNGMTNISPVKAPLCAMMGDKEENRNEISNWSKFTRSAFSFQIMEGDHFFIHHHPQRIAAIMDDFAVKISSLRSAATALLSKLNQDKK